MRIRTGANSPHNQVHRMGDSSIPSLKLGHRAFQGFLRGNPFCKLFAAQVAISPISKASLSDECLLTKARPLKGSAAPVAS